MKHKNLDVDSLTWATTDEEEAKLNLQEENDKLREALEEICYLNDIKDEEYKHFWKTVNLLIDNEIEQEKFCNQ